MTLEKVERVGAWIVIAAALYLSVRAFLPVLLAVL